GGATGGGWAARLGLWVSTSNRRMPKEGHLYMLPRNTALTASTAPENAPESITVSASMAIRVPSRFTPVLSLMMTWGAGMPASSSSRRVMTYRTGRLVTWASTAVIGSPRAP